MFEKCTTKTEVCNGKVIHYIVAANALARCRIVANSNTASFSIKTISCETNNILFSDNYWKPEKINDTFWKNIWNKDKVTLNSFQKFAYVRNSLHLKSFAWNRDCPISSKLQMSRSWPRPFERALIEFYKCLPASFHAWFLKENIFLVMFY